MQAGRGRDDVGVGVAARQHLGQAAVGARAGGQGGRRHRLLVDVAYADQFTAVGVGGDGLEVVGGDTPAADQGEADFAVKYGGWEVAHGGSLAWVQVGRSVFYGRVML